MTIKPHLLYLKYVIRHKWFVFVACNKLGVNPWRALIHDWTKFLPCEWFPYAEYFYGDWRKLKDTEPDDFIYFTIQGAKEAKFNHAWNHHQKSNKHHWQYWLLTNDNAVPKTVRLDMPKRYAAEMVADWWGAGKAITGNWDAPSWYQKNKDEILLSEWTRELVEVLLSDSEADFETPAYLEKRRRMLGH